MIPQDVEEPENNVRVRCRISHQLLWAKSRFLIEQSFQDDQRITQRARNNDIFEATKLVGSVVDQRDAAPGAKVFGVGASIQRFQWNNEAQSIGARDFSPTPCLRQRNLCLVIHQPRVGSGKRIRSDIILLHIEQPI